MQLRTCKVCAEEKAETEFRVSRVYNGVTGRLKTCRRCDYQQRKEYLTESGRRRHLENAAALSQQKLLIKYPALLHKGAADMSDTAFRNCMAFTLSEEGGFSNNPADPGGATMRGITLDTYCAFKDNWKLSPNDLKTISDADLFAIYRQNYWLKVRGDEMPFGVDLMMFDMAVNAGPTTSIKLLQHVVKLYPDGMLGNSTLYKAKRPAAPDTVRNLADIQHIYYQSLPDFDTFGAGWTARVERRMDTALRMTTP